MVFVSNKELRKRDGYGTFKNKTFDLGTGTEHYESRASPVDSIIKKALTSGPTRRERLGKVKRTIRRGASDFVTEFSRDLDAERTAASNARSGLRRSSLYGGSGLDDHIDSLVNFDILGNEPAKKGRKSRSVEDAIVADILSPFKNFERGFR